MSFLQSSMSQRADANVDELFFLPTRAVDGAVDDEPCLTIYSEDEDLVQDLAGVREAADLEKICKELGVDIDGLDYPDDVVFDSFDEAANYRPSTVGGVPVEIECVALWDHFGGNTCMDANVLANDVVQVVASEFQVRCAAKGDFLRLPTQWSLGRRISGRPVDVHMGLIPSHFLVPKKFFQEHQLFFKHPTWFRGCCEIPDAFQELISDRLAICAGLFVIFSPHWLNLNPEEPRPYLLMMTAKRDEKGCERVREEARRHFDRFNLQTSFVQSRVFNILQDHNSLTQTDETEEGSLPDALAMEYLPLIFTISRSRLGHFELFERRYWTLFDLVYDLAHTDSSLPHRLVFGRISTAMVKPAVVPKPVQYIERDPKAQMMYCEQWAALYYDQVTSKFLQEEKLKYVMRTVVDTKKKSHCNLLKTAGVPADVIRTVETYVDGFIRPKLNKGKKTETSLPPTPKKSNVKATRSWTEMSNDVIAVMICTPFFIDAADILSTSSNIGSGAFGTVVIGTLKTAGGRKDVAVKKLMIQTSKKDLRESWYGEIEILQAVSHPNVVLFHGYTIQSQSKTALLVFELMSESLDKFVEKAGDKISENEQVDFLQQISRGMDYLHSLCPPVVHADLAARNVLLKEHPGDSNRYVLKVTDFGLSKPTRDETFATYDDPNKIPVKWLPPEVLTQRDLTPKTDIWSFGMVCHELYGIGEPYGVLAACKVYHLLRDGYRFEKQRRMPSYIYLIVLECWRIQPVDRPTFAAIERRLREFSLEAELSDGFVREQRRAEQDDLEKTKQRESMIKQVFDRNT